MTTQVNSIWHDVSEKPHDNTNVVVLGPMGYDGFRWYIEEDRRGRYPYENWIKWAYLDDAISLVSKLDKTTEALNYALHVLDDLTEIGGIDLEIMKIKKMAEQ